MRKVACVRQRYDVVGKSCAIGLPVLFHKRKYLSQNSSRPGMARHPLYPGLAVLNYQEEFLWKTIQYLLNKLRTARRWSRHEQRSICRNIARDPSPLEPKPERAIGRHGDGTDVVVGQTICPGQVRPRFSVEPKHAAVKGGKPHRRIGRHGHRLDRVGDQAVVYRIVDVRAVGRVPPDSAALVGAVNVRGFTGQRRPALRPTGSPRGQRPCR